MRIFGVAVALATGSLLAGCAATAPLPDTPPSTSASPAPSATAAPAIDPVLPERPPVRYDLTCEELVPDDVLAVAFGGDGMLTAAPPEDRPSPLGSAVRQQGGLSCRWDNGEPRDTEAGYGNPAFKGLDVHLAPDPDGKWATYVTIGYPQDPVDQQFGSGSGTGCFAHEDELSTGPSCSVNVLVGDTWVDLMFLGIEVPTGTTDAQLLDTMRPVIAGIVERIPDPRPAEGAPDLTLPGCETTLPVGQVLGVLGLSDETAQHKSYGRGGYSLMTAAREYSGLQECLVGPRDSESTYASTYILPGGAWAFRPSEVGNGIGVGSEKVEVAGTTAPSYLRCEAKHFKVCSMDLAVEDDWIRVHIHEDNATTVTEADRDRVLSLGTMVVGNLR